MRVKQIHIYRDGGTIFIEMDNGDQYWIPGRLAAEHESGKIFKGAGFFQGKSVEVTDQAEIFSLTKALAIDAEIYHDIKRRIR